MLRKWLTILSLLGLVLSVIGWGASYFQIHYMGLPGGALPVLEATSGCLTWADGNTPLPSMRPSVMCRSGVVIEGFKGLKTWWKPHLAKNQNGTITAIQLPLWIPTALFGPTFTYCALPFHRRRKRKMLGLCVKCGYDLRGSSERCPECGTEIEEKVKQP